MKKFFAVIGVLLASAAMCFAQGDIEKSTLIKDGDAVPAVSIQMLDGSSLTFEALEGKVVLVNFWATWCPPCRKEFARLQKDVIDRFAGKDFVLLPISIDDDPDTVRKFMERNGYDFPVAVDPGRKIYSLFAEKYVPRNFVIGKDGKVAFYVVGYDENGEFDEMVDRIEKLL